jgi:hypothetical protein
LPRKDTKAVWKNGSSVVIWKPTKDNYMKLKAYRSESLLSCIGHVVEKVVAEVLSQEAKRRGLLSDRQFWSRKPRLVIAAVDCHGTGRYEGS